MRTFAQWTMVVAGVLVLGGVASAEQAVTDDSATLVQPEYAADTTQTMPELTVEEAQTMPGATGEVDQQAAMEKMKQLGAPSDGHKALEPLVGTWAYAGQWWMTPEAVPQPMTGTATNALIFGGRFLQQTMTGQMPDGMPFEGMGLLGYDSLRQEYQSLWIDNMMTGMMTGAGQFDAATATLTDSGSFSCPMTGETNRWYRTTWTIVDANHTTYASYSHAPDGQEFKSMEIQYTRIR